MKAYIVAILATLAAAAPVEKRGSDVPYGDKKGLCYNDNNAIEALSLPGSATWAYNWDGASAPNKFQYIPMCWSPKCDKNKISGSIKAHSPWVLGYNEPDMCTGGAGGSCTAPAAAAGSWAGDMIPFADQGAKLVCPAITSNDAPGSGFNWLGAFVQAAGGAGKLRCDAQALHWYGVNGKSGSEQGDLLIQYIKTAHDSVDKIFGHSMSLWITEFSPLPVGDVNVMADFLKKVVPFLDGADYVARYSPFKAEQLITNGKPNAAGQALISGH